MNRREVLKAGGLAGLLAAFSEGLVQTTTAQSLDTASSEYLHSVDFGFTGRYSQNALNNLYNPVLGQQPVPLPPHIFLYYHDNKFVKPQEILLTAKPAKYKLDATLHAFGISKRQQYIFKKVGADLQLGFNIGAPVHDDNLTWVFLSAVNVFLQKDEKGREQQLNDFKNHKPTENLRPQNQIVISEGKVDLQVSALGQRKQGLWTKIFGGASAVLNTPIFAALALPSLVKEALSFVNNTLKVLSDQEKLVKVWETKPITFAVHTGASKEDSYNLAQGYWVTIDRQYAVEHDFLAGHSLDIDGQSFNILPDRNPKSQPIDANYLVTYLNLTEEKPSS